MPLRRGRAVLAASSRRGRIDPLRACRFAGTDIGAAPGDAVSMAYTAPVKSRYLPEKAGPKESRVRVSRQSPQLPAPPVVRPVARRVHRALPGAAGAGAVVVAMAMALGAAHAATPAGEDGRLELNRPSDAAYVMRLSSPVRLSRAGEPLRLIVPIGETERDPLWRPPARAYVTASVPELKDGAADLLGVEVVTLDDGRRAVQVTGRSATPALAQIELTLVWRDGSFRRAVALASPPTGNGLAGTAVDPSPASAGGAPLVREEETSRSVQHSAVTELMRGASRAAGRAGGPAPDPDASPRAASTSVPAASGDEGGPPRTAESVRAEALARVDALLRAQASGDAAPSVATSAPAQDIASRAREESPARAVSRRSPTRVTESPADAPASTAARGRSAPPRLAAGSSYTVRRGDTLWAIAERARPRDVERASAMAGIYARNPQAFEARADRLVVGRELRIPEHADYASYPRQAAVRLLQDGRRPATLAAGPGTGAGTPVASAAPPAAQSAEAATPAAGGDRLALGPRGNATLAEEEADTGWKMAMAEARSRIDDLSDQVAKLKSLIALKDEAVAEAQRRLDALNNAPPARTGAAGVVPVSLPTPADPEDLNVLGWRLPAWLLHFGTGIVAVLVIGALVMWLRRRRRRSADEAFDGDDFLAADTRA